MLDDDQQLLAGLKLMLSDQGFQVICFDNPGTFLAEYLNGRINGIDLMLTDMDMGSDMTGMDLVIRLRARDPSTEKSPFPIILWSGGNLTDRAWEGWDGSYGADLLMRKSEVRKLVGNIRKLLDS